MLYDKATDRGRELERVLVAHFREVTLAPIKNVIKLVPLNGLEVIEAARVLGLYLNNGMVYTGDGRNFEDFFLERNV